MGRHGEKRTTTTIYTRYYIIAGVAIVGGHTKPFVPYKYMYYYLFTTPNHIAYWGGELYVSHQCFLPVCARGITTIN